MAKMLEITVTEEFNGKRVDVFLASAIEGITSRHAAQKLIADALVSSNGKAINKNFRVSTGDVLLYTLPAPIPLEAVPQDIPLCVVYEDNDLLVVNKPRGLVVHPGAGNLDGTLVNALLFWCKGSLSGIGGVLRPGIVHRLDKDTSGLMVVAKNDAAHVALAKQLENRTMGRTYNAVCAGILKDETRTIDLPIARHPLDRKKMTTVIRHGTKSRNATTHITVLERFKRHTLIEANLETGRTHQIRVHLAAIGYPVIGDETYAPSLVKKRSFDGQILHAKKISFIHPTSSEKMVFDSELPEYFVKALQGVAK